MSQRRHLFSTFQQCSVNLSGWLSIVSSPINCSSWHSWAYEKGLIYSYFSNRPLIRGRVYTRKFSWTPFLRWCHGAQYQHKGIPSLGPMHLKVQLTISEPSNWKLKAASPRAWKKIDVILWGVLWIILTITSGHCLEGGRSLFLGKTIWWESEMLIVANNQIPRESNFENQFV